MTTLVPGDSNGAWDVFVLDLTTVDAGSRDIARVGVATDGTQADGSSLRPTISRDGRTVAFQSGATNLVPNDTNGQYDVFVHAR